MRPTTKTTNLTPARTDLIGRDLEIARLRELLREGRLVTVTGIGGTGKTRLAREFGQQAVQDFPGGVWMVELANYDGVDEAMRDLAEMLGLGFEGTASSVALIVEALRSKPRTLLIFDNLEHIVDQVADPVARIIDRTREVCVLCTSREPLRIGGEQRFKLTPLSQQAAVDLFERRAREVVPSFRIDDINRESIEQLVDRLDRLPLAIELAASRINVLPPAQLVNRITERMSALRARDRDRPARHETLSAAIEWSWDLLTPEQRDGLSQCAVFRGGFTLEALQSVVRCGGSAEELVEDLVERSLVEFEDGDQGRRFFLFELVRGAAEAKLGESAAAASVYARHADYFVTLIEGTPADRIHERRQELPNLLVALRREHPVEKRAKIAIAAARVLRVTASVGLVEETLSEILTAVTDEATSARLLLFRAVAAYERGQHEESLRDSERAVALALKVDDVETAADALTVRGFTLSDMGLRDEGNAALRRGLALAREAGNVRLETIALGNLALVASEEGRTDEAEALFEQSLARSRSARDEILIGRSLLNLGVCQSYQGRLQEAVTHLEESLVHHDRVADDRYRGMTCLALGEVRARLGDVAGATEAYALARDIAHALGKKSAETTALIGLGELGVGAGDRTYLVQAVQINEGNQHYVDEVRARSHLAVYDLVEGRYELARPGFRRALGVLADRDAKWAGLLWGYLAISYAVATDADNASEALEHAGTAWATDSKAMGRLYEALEQAVAVFAAGTSVSPADVTRLRNFLAACVSDAPRRPIPSWPEHNPFRFLRGLLEKVIGPASTTMLSVSRDGRRYIPPNLDEVDFSRRGPLRKILVALAEARENDPGVGLSAEDVLEAGWPGDIVTVEAGAARVYSAVRTLRTHGLEDVLLTQDDGYLIDPQIAIAWLD